MENSGFITDAEFNTYINSSWKELYDLLVSAYGNDYFANPNPFAISVQNNVKLYDLPSDFYKLIGVDLVLGTNRILKLRPYQFNERDQYQTGAYWSSVIGNFGPRYRIVKNKIEFVPVADGAWTINLWYIPTANNLVLDTDVMDGVNGWEEYVILDVCIKALNKQDLSPMAFVYQKKDMKERIEGMKENRDAGMSFRVSDVNSMDYLDDISYSSGGF